MTTPRHRPRPPRIAASLRERRNDFRPAVPISERILHTFGAHPSFVDAILGDLAEERARREASQGPFVAQLWYAREALRAVPHLLANALRHGGAGGRARVAAWLAGATLVSALVTSVVMRPSAPAYLVFEGQRGSDVPNGVILNSTHPVQLVTHVLDAKGRALPASSVRYEWSAGIPVAVSSSGVVTCAQWGDAEVTASAGGVATRLLIRCRPVSRVSGDLVLSLVAGERGQALPFVAYAPNGRSEYMVAYEARVEDSTVAVLDGLQVRPGVPGQTSVVMKVGDAQTRIFVSVYERVSTLAGLRPDQRFVSAPVRLAVGDTIRWPLPTGKFWLRFTPLARARTVPRIKVSGDLACVPAFGFTDQATCLARRPGAQIRITHPGTPRDSITGNLALQRRDE